MKRWIVMLLVAVCVLGLTACENKAAKDRTPPPLYLRYGNTTVKALLGSYSWSYSMENGKKNHVEDGGIDPLASGDLAPSISAPAVELCCIGNPDRISVQRWDERGTETGLEGEEVPVRVNIVEDEVEEVLDLEAGSYHYAITLYWEESEETDGSATYYFRTETEASPAASAAG